MTFPESPAVSLAECVYAFLLAVPQCHDQDICWDDSGVVPVGSAHGWCVFFAGARISHEHGPGKPHRCHVVTTDHRRVPTVQFLADVLGITADAAFEFTTWTRDRGKALWWLEQIIDDTRPQP